jgi:hypothetical protein
MTPGQTPPLFVFPSLHHHAAPSGRLWRVWIVLLVDWSPNGWNHEVACRISVGNDAEQVSGMIGREGGE